MVSYTAHFKISLTNPIETLEESLPLLEHKSTFYKTEMFVRIKAPVKNNLVSEFQVSVTYTDDNLQHVTAGGDPSKGIFPFVPDVPSNGHFVFADYFIGMHLIEPLIYHLSGITLQTNIFWDVFKNLKEHVLDFTWELPDGKKVSRIPMRSPFLAYKIIRETGRNPLSVKDWEVLQGFINGTNEGSPLWRIILAEAHRERYKDIRNVVLKCATALELGIQPHLPKGRKFNMELFHREKAIIPDLKDHDSDLYNSLSRIWYSRHGIIHKGGAYLYENNPINPETKPLRCLNDDDGIEFLQAVPKGIEYVVSRL